MATTRLASPTAGSLWRRPIRLQYSLGDCLAAVTLCAVLVHLAVQPWWSGDERGVLFFWGVGCLGGIVVGRSLLARPSRSAVCGGFLGTLVGGAVEYGALWQLWENPTGQWLGHVLVPWAAVTLLSLVPSWTVGFAFGGWRELPRSARRVWNWFSTSRWRGSAAAVGIVGLGIAWVIVRHSPPGRLENPRVLSQLGAMLAPKAFGAALSPDGKEMAVGDNSGIVTIHRTSDGKKLRQWLAFRRADCSLLDWSPDGSTLAVASRSRDGCQVYDPITGDRRAAWSPASPRGPGVDDCRFSQDGRSVLLSGGVSAPSQVVAWDFHSGVVQRRSASAAASGGIPTARPTGRGWEVAHFRPISSDSEKVEIWLQPNPESSEMYLGFNMIAGAGHTVMSSNGSRLALGNACFDLKTGARRALPGEARCFSPNATHVALVRTVEPSLWRRWLAQAKTKRIPFLRLLATPMPRLQIVLYDLAREKVIAESPPVAGLASDFRIVYSRNGCTAAGFFSAGKSEVLIWTLPPEGRRKLTGSASCFGRMIFAIRQHAVPK